MKFWTTQTEEVLKCILENKIYKPDFKLSNGLGGERMKVAYDGMLSEYQSRNQIQCDGLVFGLSQLEDTPIKSIEQYRDYFYKNSTYWDSVSNAGENYTILELDISDKLDLIPIYLQDFIILGYRSIKSMEFSEYVKEEFINEKFHSFGEDLEIAQNKGWTDDVGNIFIGSLLNRITQAHVHEISFENIINVYSTVNFITNEEYKLNDTANEIKKIIVGE